MHTFIPFPPADELTLLLKQLEENTKATTLRLSILSLFGLIVVVSAGTLAVCLVCAVATSYEHVARTTLITIFVLLVVFIGRKRLAYDIKQARKRAWIIFHPKIHAATAVKLRDSTVELLDKHMDKISSAYLRQHSQTLSEALCGENNLPDFICNGLRDTLRSRVNDLQDKENLAYRKQSMLDSLIQTLQHARLDLDAALTSPIDQDFVDLCKAAVETLTMLVRNTEAEFGIEQNRRFIRD